MTLDQMRYWPNLAINYARLVQVSAPRAVIHTNWHHALLLLPFLNPRRDIFWLHDILPDSQHYAIVFRAITKRVNRFVCVSEAVARSALALGLPFSKITVIYNGVPLAPPHAVSISSMLRLGIVGQVGSWKGHDDLIEAIGVLARDGVRVSLNIFRRGRP